MRAAIAYVAGITLAGLFSVAAAGQGAAHQTSGVRNAPHPAFVLGPIVGKTYPSISVPVRALPLRAAEPGAPAAVPRVNPLQNEPDQGRRGTWRRGRPPLDPLTGHSQAPSGSTPPPDIVFDGTANPFACNGCSPPDPNGDTDRQYFIQMVNSTKVGIYDRLGNLAKPAFDLGSLWTSGPCTKNLGDPQARYDRLAQRWILSQFERKELCFAVSQTADPLGAYYLYAFEIGALPDYYKVGVWQNAYYVGTNESTYSAYAFDRAKMLAGAAASFIKFTGQTNFLMPADADGTDWPSDAGYFYTFKDDAFHGGVDRIELFRFTPNFDNPSASKFKLASTFNIAPFTYTVCGFFKTKCISQKGTTQKIDAVSEWPMQRLEYRRMGKTWQELVGNFTVGGGTGKAGAAIRWFELRNTGGGWILWQEGTQDPGDGLDRFMGSISMDRDGNIALGYSASGKNDFPSIRYATRLFSDAKGTLSPEVVLKAGNGAQTASDRWGDYSAMTVDPAGGCQFWYTNSYYPVSSANNWATAVGAFTIPGCSGGAASYDAGKDFSGTKNTDGRPWTYRYSTSGIRDGNYTLQDTMLVSNGDWHDAAGNPVTLNYWSNVGATYSNMSANKTSDQLHISYCCGNVYLDADQVFVDPGTQMAVLSFTAPVGGMASIKYSFAHIDCHGGNGINWYLDLDTTSGHTNMGTGYLKTNTCAGDGSTGLLNSTVNVAAGDRINFVIDNNGNPSFDSSEISAKISIR